jgi:hypothetical protein
LDDTGGIFGMVPEMEENAPVYSSGFGCASPSGIHGQSDLWKSHQFVSSPVI